MSDNPKYLVVIDPTKIPQPALVRAGWLARHSNASLHLYACVYNQALSGDVFFDSPRLAQSRESFMQHRGKWLESLAAPYRKAGIEVTTQAEWGKRYQREILAAVDEAAPDLVVKETVYHNKLKRALVSSADWALIRECPTEVLLVRAGDWPDEPLIVAAVDPFNVDDKPAALDDRIITQASRMAGFVAGKLRLLHAWQPLEPAAVAPMPVAILDGVDNDALRATRREGVEKLAEKHGIASENVAICEGDAGHALPDYVEETGASLMVMGAVSRNRLERLVIGSTAERILDRLACDVLIVRSED